MRPSVTKMINTAIRVSYLDNEYHFTCEIEPFKVELYNVTVEELRLTHPHLPQAARYICEQYTASAGACLRLTLEHWAHPELAVCLGGQDFASVPRAIEVRPPCYLVTSDIYNMVALPAGGRAAFLRQANKPSMVDDNWLSKNYPGAVEKLNALTAISGFKPQELATYIFDPQFTPKTSVDTSGLTFDT